MDFEIAIIGSSLSGAALALELGRAGVRTLLIDKDTFPRRKPCGEGLSSEAIHSLDRLGIDWRVLPHRLLDGYTITTSNGCAILSAPEGELGAGIRRSELDVVVLNAAAAQAPIEIVQGAKVAAVDQLRESVVLHTPRGRISARSVVIADGTSSLISQRLGIPERRKSSMRYGASCICRSEHPGDRVTILPRDGFELYLTPVGANLLNLSILGERDAARRYTERSGDGIKQLLDAASHALQADVQLLEPLLGAGPIAPRRRVPSFGRALLIGDACEALDPVSGMGMTHALGSALLAAEHLREHFLEGSSFDSSVARYGTAREHLVRPMRGYTRLVYLLVGKLQSVRTLRAADRTGLASNFREAALGKRHPLSAAVLRWIGSPDLAPRHERAN